MGATVELSIAPQLPENLDWAIGCIGAGFIMRDVHLAAYREVGYKVAAIASRTPEHARTAAEQWAIPTVHETWAELVADPQVEIVDIAYPPDQQLEIVRRIAEEAGHVKGILAQKPLATNLAEAQEIVRICDEAGITLGVNQNMRYDQSIRALKSLLDGGHLGEPVAAQIVMNARPHWQEFIRGYGRIAILNMSIHHLDAYRYLFGDPDRVFASVRNDPSWDFEHDDGLAFYILEYGDGLRAIGSDNCFTWADHRIEWRVEGTEGIAKGTIGWPDYPHGSPSTIEYHLGSEPDTWHRPKWGERWFPHAFVGTMAQLLRAVEDGSEPEISGRDNLGTMALVEAAYRSVDDGRAVSPADVLSETSAA
jgi:predicted dehydrogenase